MPIFVLKCKCGSIKEVICRHSAIQETACSCGKVGEMEILPQSPLGVVHGFNAANGYHRETINYDGRKG